MSQHQLERTLQRSVSATRIVPTFLPLAPQVQLYLIADDYPRGRLAPEEMQAIMEKPAYWAFCWASGQVLARHLFANPEAVADKTVLDFGCGSGVVGIAAALCGARRVICCDIDHDALAAVDANANLNGVSVQTCDDLFACPVVDLVIAADVLYDRDNMPLLETLPDYGSEILLADSRVKRDRIKGYHLLEQVTATTIPDLDEMAEFNQVRVYRRQQD